MISIRRLIASILAGGLLILVSAAQASAQAPPALERALQGVGLGLDAAAEVLGDGDVLEVDQALLDAFGAYGAWYDRHFAPDSKRQGLGQGPVQAARVQQALANDDLPSELDKVNGSKLGELAGVYEQLKGKSDVAKAAKENKAKENKGRSDDAKDNAPGQQP